MNQSLFLGGIVSSVGRSKYATEMLAAQLTSSTLENWNLRRRVVVFKSGFFCPAQQKILTNLALPEGEFSRSVGWLIFRTRPIAFIM
jgi:hypothetical protein